MDNNPSEEVSPLPKWHTLLRQNSEKFVEDVVLPKNQRSATRSSEAKHVPLQNVGARSVYVEVYTTRKRIPEMEPKYFPFFMIGISLIQVILMYTVDSEALLVLFGYDPHRRHELWRFITLMLVHTGLSHMWTNVLLQMILGVLLEIIHHSKRIAVIYLASVVGGTLFVSAISPQMYVVGASGGVYGLLFAHLSTIILNWNEMDRKACRLFWIISYIIFDFGLSFYLESNPKAESNIGHVATVGHVGGAITGFLVAILVLKNFEKHPWEKKLQKICVGALSVIVVIVVLVNIFAWDHYLPTEWNFNYFDTFEKYMRSVNVNSEP